MTKWKNKKATESWTILKSELEVAICRYVPMTKQGKRSKKKHLSNAAFKKIIYKIYMWRVYINIRERIKIMKEGRKEGRKSLFGKVYINWWYLQIQ